MYKNIEKLINKSSKGVYAITILIFSYSVH